MNKKLIYLLMLVFTLGLSFTACSDDDDDDKKVDYAKDIAATYAGTLTIPGLSVQPIVIENKDLGLTRTANNKAKVELRDLAIELIPGTPTPIGTISVDNIEVSKSGDTYTLKETTATITISLSATPVDVKVSGTVKNSKLDLAIGVSKITGMEPLAISYAGTAKNK